MTKKITFSAIFFIVLVQLCQAPTTIIHAALNKPKKKILIFTSKGGYGHAATCKALTNLLSSDYEITVVNPFEQLLVSFDPVKKISSIDGEQLYNKLLQSGYNSFINVMCSYFVPPLLRSSNQKKEKLFFDYVKEKQPDFIISVIPFVNLAISSTAHKLNIPFLLVTTDGDVTQWVHGLKHMTCKNFMVTIGFETNKTRKKLCSCGIEDKKIQLAGFPIRPDFLERKDKKLIQKQWQLPANKFTIMLMMGGVGTTNTYYYARKIMNMDLPIHLIVCAGKNQQMIEQLSKITPKNKVSVSFIPFTDRISDLMAASDLLITKPGPGSINEALHMRLPMLIDAITTPVFWEKENIKFVLQNHWGDTITSMHKLEKKIRSYLYDHRYRTTIKKALTKFKPQNFSKTIVNALETLQQEQNDFKKIQSS